MKEIHDLLIVGCGPVGAVAGNLAGRAGLATVVLDRAPDVFDLPRAIHFDAHIMRILQQAGVARQMLPTVRVWERSTFYGADGQPIRVHEWPLDKTYGWDAHYLFYQPTLEKILREGLDRFPGVRTRSGVEVVAVAQHEDHVVATTREVATGQVEEVAARYVLGADGASSFVRSNAGIRLLDGNFDEPWLVVDLFCERELGRPNESEMFCDPRRPSTRVPGPGQHHRWEFMLLPGETPEQIQHPDAIAKLLAPWVAMDEVRIIRASVYRFHSLIAQRWRDRRVLLVGDAAHQTPPFLGQGMCHGIRDVQNLLWKIAAALDGGRTEDLLDSYEAERRPHVSRIIEMAVAAGRDICVLDPVVAAERDTRTRNAVTTGQLPRTTFQGMPPLSGGLLSATVAAGDLFPQPTVRTRSGEQGMFDDLVPYDIAVVANHQDVAGMMAAASPFGVPVIGVGGPPDTSGADFGVASEQLEQWFAEHNGRIAILRPDRYVYALTADVGQAQEMLRELCLVVGRTPVLIASPQ